MAEKDEVMERAMKELGQQMNQAVKEEMKKAVKESFKKVGQQIWSAIAPYMGYIIAAIVIIVIIVGCVDWDNVGITASAEGYSSISVGISSIGAEYLASWENNTVRKYLNGEISYEGDRIKSLISEDKEYFICYTDYPEDDQGDRNFAYGICHTINGVDYWHVQEYAKVGITIDSGEYNEVGISKIPVSDVNEVFSGIYDIHKKSVQKQFNGIDIEETELDALTAVSYQYGNIGNAVELYQSNGDFTEDFKTTDGYYPFNENKNYKGPVDRVKANKTLFYDGVYNAGDGTVLTKNNFIGSSIARTAINIHDYIKTNKYAYSCSDNVNNNYSNSCACDGISHFGINDFQKYKDIKCIDCSAYVSWVLNEYLGDENFNTRWTSYDFYDENKWPSGWEKINLNDIEAGDILVKETHVGIYIGDGKTVEAGSTSAIREDFSYGNIQGIVNDYEFAIRIK